MAAAPRARERLHFRLGTRITVGRLQALTNARPDGSFTTDRLAQLDSGATNDVLQRSRLRYAPDAIASKSANADWLSNTIQGLSAFDGPYGNWTIENEVIMVEVGLAMGLANAPAIGSGAACRALRYRRL